MGQLGNSWLGGEQIGEVVLAGVSVQLFENSAMPNSRYFYPWAIDDVDGVFDGADRESLERWLATYLKELTQADQ